MKILIHLMILSHLLLVSCVGGGDSTLTFEDNTSNSNNGGNTSSDNCLSFENSQPGTITPTISGSNVTIDWANIIAEADSFAVSIEGPPNFNPTTSTKPMTFNSLMDGTYTARVTYSKVGCNDVFSTQEFVIDTTVDCTAWDAATIATTTNVDYLAGGNINVSWSGGNITGQTSFNVVVSGASPTETITDMNPANFTGLNPGTHTATINYFRTGCTSKSQVAGTGDVPVSFSMNVLPALSTCTGCHGSSGGYTASLYSEYSETTTSCGVSEPRVLSGNGAGSAFYRKISSSDCGPEMGTGGYGTLTTAQRDMIRTWIDEGATDN